MVSVPPYTGQAKKSTFYSFSEPVTPEKQAIWDCFVHLPKLGYRALGEQQKWDVNVLPDTVPDSVARPTLNHRINHWFGMEGTSGEHPVQPTC